MSSSSRILFKPPRNSSMYSSCHEVHNSFPFFCFIISSFLCQLHPMPPPVSLHTCDFAHTKNGTFSVLPLYCTKGYSSGTSLISSNPPRDVFALREILYYLIWSLLSRFSSHLPQNSYSLTSKKLNKQSLIKRTVCHIF